MTDHLILWIALCAFLSFGLVWLQYFFKPQKSPYRVLLAALRFLAWLGLFLLLLNPKVERTTTYVEKQHLALVLDNSSSISGENDREVMRSLRDTLLSDQAIAGRFTLDTYTFGTAISQSDSLDFTAEGTDIAAALETLANSLIGQQAQVVLVTDGNENLGRSYLYAASADLPVYPVVVGDTTRYRDIRIDRLTVNRYAFLGNQFPLEVLLSYTGEAPVSAELVIEDNGSRIRREPLQFEGGGGTRRLELLLEATSVGFHSLVAYIRPLEGERNTANNRRRAGLEVVDESTRILLVSRKTHPDIGALRRSIERNEQREVTITTPQEAINRLDAADLLILYQPDAGFRGLYQALSERDIPLFTIVGPMADWDFLNDAQRTFELLEPGPIEDLLPVRNAGFSYFDLSEWDVANYPPLASRLGNLLITSENQVVLEQRFRGVDLTEPMLALIKGTKREALLQGSGIWKWRMSDFRNSGNFESFDTFLGKVLLFLSAEGSSKRLTLDYQPLFEDSGNALIRARYFDDSFVFDPEARLSLQLTDSTGNTLEKRPMALRTGFFEADVGGLPPGTYRFTVLAEDTPFSESGQFSLQEFDLEAQQLSSDAAKLSRLAELTGGALYFPSEYGILRDSLLHSDRFRPVQKSRRNIVSLVDYRWLLFGIIFCLAAEWFIRKYNGLL